jgi:WD40 repeat protein
MRFLNVKAGGFRSFRFSSDGKWLATGHEDGSIRIWDPQSGRQLTAYKSAVGHPIADLVFSPDSTLLATALRKGAHVYFWRVEVDQSNPSLQAGWWRSDYPKSRLLTTMEYCAGGDLQLGFTIDGKRLIVGTDLSRIRSIPIHTGKVAFWQIERKAHFSLACNYSKQQELLAQSFRYGDGVHLHELKDQGTYLGSLNHASDVLGLVFTPDDTRLVTIASRKLRMWDVNSKNCIWEQTASKKHLLAVDISPDGRTILTAGNDREVTFWDAETGREKQRFTFNVGKITRALFSPDGLTATAGGTSRKMVLWDVDG